MIDKFFSLLKFVRRARFSHLSLRIETVKLPASRVDVLKDIWVEKLTSLERKNSGELRDRA